MSAKFRFARACVSQIRLTLVPALLLLLAMSGSAAPAMELNLRSGWNLVALPEHPADGALPAAAASLGDNLICIWTYRTGKWLGYAPATPEISDLTRLQGGEGYWIRMRREAKLVLAGNGRVVSMVLNEGWNLAGANGHVAAPPALALNDAAANTQSVWAFNRGWRVCRPGETPAVGAGEQALELMQDGSGYWIRTTARTLWDNQDAYGIKPPVSTETQEEAEPVVAVAGEAVTAMLSDGSAAAMQAEGAPLAGSFAKLDADPGYLVPGMTATGPERILDLETAADPETVIPEIVFPAADAGTLTPETLAVARTGPVIRDGAYVPVYTQYLTPWRDAQGNLRIRDRLAPLSLQAYAQSPEGRAQGSRAGDTAATRIRYQLVSFQGMLNWNVAPKLARMIPDPKAPGYRRKFESLSADEREAEDRKPVQNVIVFIHGHNEQEKDGIPGNYTPDISGPWMVAYKRAVWSLMYKEALREDPATKAKVHAAWLENTRFYEFIYPSYRSIFTYLGSALAGALEAEFAKQIQPPDRVGEQNMPFNLFVVAHSMGGLVGRAGVNELDAPLDDWLEKLATWGSPHHGSSLPTLSYLLQAPGIYVAISEGGAPINFEWVQKVASGMSLDTPGNRDLRWDNFSPLGLDLSFEPTAGPMYDLNTGTWLYNPNTLAMNQNDRIQFNTNKLDRPVYAFMYGVTNRRVNELAGLSAAMTAVGATIIPETFTLPDAPYAYLPGQGFKIGDSDGAVPISSMVAEGIVGERRYLGDLDHEQYFGSPSGEVVSDQENGDLTAQSTFGPMGLALGNGIYAGPQIQFTTPAANTIVTDNTVAVAGNLNWPGDPMPGKRVKRLGGAARVLGVPLSSDHQYLLTHAFDKRRHFQFNGRDYVVEPKQILSGLNLTDLGGFSGSMPVVDPKTTAGVAVFIEFPDRTELAGVQLLEAARPITSRTRDMTCTWEVGGITRIFPYYTHRYGFETNMHYDGDYPEAGEQVDLDLTIQPLTIQEDGWVAISVGAFNQASEFVFQQDPWEPDAYPEGIMISRSYEFPGHRIVWEDLGIASGEWGYVSYSGITIGYNASTDMEGGISAHAAILLHPGYTPLEAYEGGPLDQTPDPENPRRGGSAQPAARGQWPGYLCIDRGAGELPLYVRLPAAAERRAGR